MLKIERRDDEACKAKENGERSMMLEVEVLFLEIIERD